MSLLKVAGTTASSGTLYVDDVFSVYLYTGNGSTQTITNGIDLAGKGGLVWTKNRDTGGYHHVLCDTARGMGNWLDSNLTAPDSTGSGFSATSTGYVAGGAGGNTNQSTKNDVSWTFREAPKFFDVVTYTGNGTNPRNISHSLASTPGMVIVKRTDGGGGSWFVYQRSAAASGFTPEQCYMNLNNTNAVSDNANIWYNTAPTSTVFTVGSQLNISGGTYVAYLYAHDTSSTGIIQCGSFTTDGSGNATVNLGWEPQYVLSKASSMAGVPWVIADTMRGFNVNTTDNVNELYPNWSDKEFLNSYIQLTGTGFKSTNQLQPSTTYIYMAIRMPNKPPTTGTQVYNAIARTGTGANATISSVGFTPDVYLVKDKTSLGNYFGFLDRLRGVDLAAFVANFSEGSLAGLNELLSLNMDGFSLGSSAGWYTNKNAIPYINYSFKRAPGFFDEVCYTGNGGASQNVNHNLTIAPDLLIVKSRSQARLWAVYVSSLGASNAMQLNFDYASAASGYWNSTTPTSSVFTVGNTANTNGSAENYVAYLFATLAGISKVGSYTGNGSTGQAIACGFSAGARFVLIKRTDSTGDWYTFDSARGLTSGSSPYLLLNSTAAEVTGNNGVYASSGGFTLGATASTTTNINGASYIFLSVA